MKIEKLVITVQEFDLQEPKDGIGYRADATVFYADGSTSHAAGSRIAPRAVALASPSEHNGVVRSAIRSAMHYALGDDLRGMSEPS